MTDSAIVRGTILIYSCQLFILFRVSGLQAIRKVRLQEKGIDFFCNLLYK